MDQPARSVAYGSLNSECRCLKLVDTFRDELFDLRPRRLLLVLRGVERMGQACTACQFRAAKMIPNEIYRQEKCLHRKNGMVGR